MTAGGGRKADQSPAPGREWSRARPWLRAFGAAGILVLVAKCNPPESPEVSTQIAEILRLEESDTVDLSVVADFAWDRVCIATPYMGRTTVWKGTGSPWLGPIPGFADWKSVLIFMKGRRAVRHTVHHDSIGIFRGDDEMSCHPPDDARFLVSRPMTPGRAPRLVHTSEPAPAAFITQLPPGEGRPRFVATGRAIVGRKGPSRSAEIVFRNDAPEPGSGIEAEESRVITVVPGRAVARTATEIEGRSFGRFRTISRRRYYGPDAPRVTRPLSPGDGVALFGHRAEGSCFIGIGAETLEAHLCPTFRPDDFAVREEPTLEWWIQMRWEGGPAYWLLVEDSVLDVEREF